jgi:hypothetical protein
LDQFAGTWIENEAERKLGSAPNLRFRATGDGKLEELRGPEAVPLVQPITLDGKPYGLPESGNRVAWTKIDDTHFERKLYNGDTLLTTRRIQLSGDGSTLTEEFERKRPDGTTTVLTSVFKRKGTEGKGLAGTWSLQSLRSSAPRQLKIVKAGSDGLTLTTDIGAQFTVKFDGKPVPLTGAGLIPNMTVVATRSADRTIELTDSRNGTVVSKQVLSLAPDGKTLTSSVTNLAPGASGSPSVTVYRRQ